MNRAHQTIKQKESNIQLLREKLNKVTETIKKTKQSPRFNKHVNISSTRITSSKIKLIELEAEVSLLKDLYLLTMRQNKTSMEYTKSLENSLKALSSENALLKERVGAAHNLIKSELKEEINKLLLALEKNNNNNNSV